MDEEIKNVQNEDGITKKLPKKQLQMQKLKKNQSGI